MKTSKRAALLGSVLMLFCVSGNPALASTNPDTPTTLNTNRIIAHAVKDGAFLPEYFKFSAGPGTIKLRLTLRPNSDGITGFVSVQDQDGKEIANISGGTRYNDTVKTASFDLPAAQTLVLRLSGNANVYGARHATVRIQIDGNVQLDKQAKPLTISLVQ